MRLQHAAPVAPAEGQADLRLAEPAALQRLAHEGQGDAHADGVEPEQIAEVVGPRERGRVAVAEHGAEREDRLVLRHLRLEAGQLALANLILLAAGHRALEAGGVLVVEVRVHLLAGDRHRVREDFLAQVVGAERAQRVDRLHQERRPVGGERLGAGLERLALLLEQGLERGRVGHLRLARARHDHRLDPLAAEHRGEPAAAREGLAVLPVGAHRREAHEVLAAGPDGHRVHVAALDRLDGVHRVARGLAPEPARRLELGARLGDLDVHRLRGAAGDHDGVEAGALHGGGPAAAEGRVEEEPGERRLARHAGAAVAGHGGVGDRAHREDHRVGGIVGVHARRHVIEQEPGREAVAAQQAPRQLRGDGLDAAPAVGDVHEQDPAAVASHGRPF